MRRMESSSSQLWDRNDEDEYGILLTRDGEEAESFQKV